MKSSIIDLILKEARIKKHSYEFPTEEAYKDYLEKHPDADKSKHSIKPKEKRKLLEKVFPKKKLDEKTQKEIYQKDIDEKKNKLEKEKEIKENEERKKWGEEYTKKYKKNQEEMKKNPHPVQSKIEKEFGVKFNEDNKVTIKGDDKDNVEVVRISLSEFQITFRDKDFYSTTLPMVNADKEDLLPKIKDAIKKSKEKKVRNNEKSEKSKGSESKSYSGGSESEKQRPFSMLPSVNISRGMADIIRGK